MNKERNETENLKKLADSSILSDFVSKHDGEWDHQAWLDLCHNLDEEGYIPINFDQIGLLLEEKRTVYLNGKKNGKVQ